VLTMCFLIAKHLGKRKKCKFSSFSLSSELCGKDFMGFICVCMCVCVSVDVGGR